MVDEQDPVSNPKDGESDRKAQAEARQQRWRRRWHRLTSRTQLLVLLILLASLCWIFRKRMFITVDSGNVVVVYWRFFGGTSHNLVGREGLHIIFPWDKATIYNTRTQTVALPLTVLSRNGLEVKLDSQIRFHVSPDVVPSLHRRYGPDYVKSIIRPQLTEFVQRVIGQYLPEELYGSESAASANQILFNARRTIGGVFIEVEDVALFNIRLPQKVQEAVQAKAEAEQHALAKVYAVQQEELETQRKLNEAKGLRQYAETVIPIPESVLAWKGIEATLELAKSPNAKVIVIGNRDNLPLLLGKVP